MAAVTLCDDGIADEDEFPFMIARRANVTAVVFDMDGLLIDSERVIFDAMREVARRHELVFGINEFSQLLGRTKRASAMALQEILGDRLSATEFSVAADEISLRVFSDGIPLKPGVPELLGHLSVRGMPMAVATSTGAANARNKLARGGLLPHFQHVVGGDDIKHSKPAPDIYLEAARRLGVPTAECIAFEDSENGVRAAVAAGMQVIQVPDLVAPSENLRALGHHVAATLLAGASDVGLLHGLDAGRHSTTSIDPGEIG